MKLNRLAIILVICIAVAAVIPAVTGEETQALIQSQIERAVVSYAAAGTRDEQALSALASLDPSLGEKWTRIMDLWDAPVSVNEQLPDDLPDDLL